MGEVYRARDTRLGRDVAIKVIPPEFARDSDRIKRFEQEARAAGALTDPNVCAIHDVGAHEGSPFVVMELLEGETLREKLASGPIPVRKALDYAAQTARGLAAAHAKGIVHRDLKPANVFVTKDGRVKVLDFGLAKLTRPGVVAPSGETAPSVAATETGVLLGTVGYMSPEQVRGLQVDHRSDIFSLGAILYELLTRKRAFQGATYVETLSAILNSEPSLLSAGSHNIPPSLEPILRRCLEKSPDERFQSARDLAFDLENVGEGSTSYRGTAGWGRGPLRARTRIAIVATSLLVVVTLFATSVLPQLGRRQRTDPSLVKYTQLTVQRGLIHRARFSPDGKSVLYSAAWDGRPLEVFETRPGYPASRSIVPAPAGLLSVARTGIMAVKLGLNRSYDRGTLAEIPAAGGTPRLIREDVGEADWSRDGRTLALSYGAGGKERLEMPRGHPIYETAGSLWYVRVSPDGRYAAFVDGPIPNDNRGRVTIVDRAGRVCAQTMEWNQLQGMAWSSDGREVWFGASQDGATCEIRAVTPSGRQRVVCRFDGVVRVQDIAPNGQVLLNRRSRQVGIRGRMPGGHEELELGWFDEPAPADISNDGRQLLFTEEGIFGGPGYAACLRGMDGSVPVRLGEGLACALSPDGRWALAIHLGLPQRLLFLPTGVGDSTSLPRGAIEKYLDAHWMPDGRQVIFTGSEAGHGPRVYVQGLKGGLPRPISREGMVGSRVSADGKSVAVVSADQHLHICSTSGDSAVHVAALRPYESIIQWCGDGRCVYVGEPGTSMNVSRIEVATGKRTPWGQLRSSEPVGGVNFAVMTPDGRGYAYFYWRHHDILYLVEGLK